MNKDYFILVTTRNTKIFKLLFEYANKNNIILSINEENRNSNYPILEATRNNNFEIVKITL